MLSLASKASSHRSSQERIEILTRGSSPRGANPFEYKGKPGFLKLLQRNLGLGSWSELIAVLGRVLPIDQRKANHDRQCAGSADAQFYRQIATTEIGKQLLIAIKEAPIGGGQQWQTLWRMLRACAILAESGGDFEAYLRQSGVFEILSTDLPVGSPRFSVGMEEPGTSPGSGCSATAGCGRQYAAIRGA